MKDWEAAIRTWEKNGYSKPKGRIGVNGVKIADEKEDILDGIL